MHGLYRLHRVPRRRAVAAAAISVEPPRAQACTQALARHKHTRGNEICCALLAVYAHACRMRPRHCGSAVCRVLRRLLVRRVVDVHVSVLLVHVVGVYSIGVYGVGVHGVGVHGVNVHGVVHVVHVVNAVGSQRDCRAHVERGYARGLAAAAATPLAN